MLTEKTGGFVRASVLTGETRGVPFERKYAFHRTLLGHLKRKGAEVLERRGRDHT